MYLINWINGLINDTSNNYEYQIIIDQINKQHLLLSQNVSEEECEN